MGHCRYCGSWCQDEYETCYECHQYYDYDEYEYEDWEEESRQDRLLHPSPLEKQLIHQLEDWSFLYRSESFTDEYFFQYTRELEVYDSHLCRSYYYDFVLYIPHAMRPAKDEDSNYFPKIIFIECDGFKWHQTPQQLINDHHKDRAWKRYIWPLPVQTINFIRFTSKQINSKEYWSIIQEYCR